MKMGLIMSEMSDYFDEHGYIYLEDVLDHDVAVALSDSLHKQYSEQDGFRYDNQCNLSPAFYANSLMENLLHLMKPIMEEATGRKLLPTYSYARIYRPDEELHIHKDREACEISATLTLNFSGDKIWPIHFSKDKDAENVIELSIPVGSMVVYKGMDMWHWRAKYTEGNWQTQVFLHYVDANGPYKDWKDDKKISNKHEQKKDTTKEENKDDFWHFGQLDSKKYLFTTYDEFLTTPLIDNVLDYTNEKLSPAGLYGGNVNNTIRRAYECNLPKDNFEWLYRRVEEFTMRTNSTNFRFNVDRLEELTYVEYHGNNKGHYNWHVDGQIHMSRKISFSIMLSDPSEFEGGDLILNDGTDHITKKVKGRITFFPSFTLHRVTPVTSGIRRVIVSWVHGPLFS